MQIRSCEMVHTCLMIRKHKRGSLRSLHGDCWGRARKTRGFLRSLRCTCLHLAPHPQEVFTVLNPGPSWSLRSESPHWWSLSQQERHFVVKFRAPPRKYKFLALFKNWKVRHTGLHPRMAIIWWQQDPDVTLLYSRTQGLTWSLLCWDGWGQRVREGSSSVRLPWPCFATFSFLPPFSSLAIPPHLYTHTRLNTCPGHKHRGKTPIFSHYFPCLYLPGWWPKLTGNSQGDYVFLLGHLTGRRSFETT